jgi:hypothetical protein
VAYFAEVQDGIVQKVIAVSNDNAPDPATEHSEPLGKAFIRDTLGLTGEWVQTSYNNSFRVRYAGIGYHWDEEGQAFYPPSPYPSWVLDTSTWEWAPPVPYPENYEEVGYHWDEAQQEWVLAEG